MIQTEDAKWWYMVSLKIRELIQYCISVKRIWEANNITGNARETMESRNAIFSWLVDLDW